MQKKQVLQIGVLASALMVSAWLAIDIFYPSAAPVNNKMAVSPAPTETKMIPPPERVDVTDFVAKQRVIVDGQLLNANGDLDLKLRQLRSTEIEAAIAENKAAVREAALRGKQITEAVEIEPKPTPPSTYQQMMPAQLSPAVPVRRTRSAYEDAVLTYFDSVTGQAYLTVLGTNYKASPGMTIDGMKVVSINEDGVWVSAGSKRRLLTGNQAYSLPPVIMSKEKAESRQLGE